MAKAVKKVIKKRRERKNVEKGAAHIQSTFNNTIITITDTEGNAVSWASAGELGFKGSRKSTPYASQTAAEQAGKIAVDHGMKTVEVYVKGPGSGRDPDPAQRLPSAQAQTRVMIEGGITQWQDIQVLFAECAAEKA